MQSLNLFDEEITDLLEDGRKPAITYAKKHAVHALATAAGILSLDDKNAAIKMMEVSLEIQPTNPLLYGNLTCLLCQEERYDEALEYGRQGIALPNANADMWYNFAVVCKNMGNLDQAANAFRKARDLNPACAMTHRQLASVLFPLGHYEEALQEEEWRFKAISGLRTFRNRYAMPDWDGKTDLKDVRILVFIEQGDGDAFQFSRYIPKLKELGAYVILEVKQEIHDLYVNAPYVDQLVIQETPLPEHQLVVSINSLPYHLDSRLENIDSTVPYIFPLEKNTKANALLNNCTKFKLGIIWAGSHWHPNDKIHSCFLKYFKPVVDLDLQVFSLQQGIMVRSWPCGNAILQQGDNRIDVVNLLEESQSIKYIDLAEHMIDFNDTALALKNLDLLLTVDTSTAHLAGALGLPVWLLLHYTHEWRWRLKWYPTMRVFCQTKPGDWQGLLETVATEMQKLIL